jgi:hypothetical protein
LRAREQNGHENEGKKREAALEICTELNIPQERDAVKADLKKDEKWRVDPVWCSAGEKNLRSNPAKLFILNGNSGLSSSASGTSATKNSTDSGVPLSGTSSNSSWIVVI